MEDGHCTRGAMVEVVALEVFQHFYIGPDVGARDAGGGYEGADGFRGKAAAAKAGESGHAGIVPAVDAVFLHELDEAALAEDGVGDVETIEFNLLRGEDA